MLPSATTTAQAAAITLAPLSVPEPTLPAIRRQRRSKYILNPALFVPLFYAALLYMAGIVLAHLHYFRPGLLLASLAPIVAAAAISISKAPRIVWLPIAALWFVLGLWSAETEPEPAANPVILSYSDGLLRTVEGSIVNAEPIRNNRIDPSIIDPSLQDSDSTSEPASNSQRTQQVDLAISSVEAISDTTDAMQTIAETPSARVRITIHWPATPHPSSSQPLDSLQCGQHIRAVLRMLPPDTFHDPGVWSLPNYLASEQISATATLVATQQDNGEPRLVLTGAPAINSPPCWLNRMRTTASAQLETLPFLTRNLSPPLRATPEDAAMLTAMLTGDRSFLTHSLRAGFERTGSFHLIVVSGLHLAILAGLVLSLAQRLRIPRLAATAVTLAITLAYALFTGFAIPAQRSFWMIALYLIGRLLYRSRSPLNVIGFAALCVSAVSPRTIFDASFQMTFIAVAAIAGIAMPLLENTLHVWSRATRDLTLISIDSRLPPRIAQFRVTFRLIAHHLEHATSHHFAWKLFPLIIRVLCRLGELLFVTLTVELALALPMAIYFHRITAFALPVNLLILPLLTVIVPGAMLTLLLLLALPASVSILAAIPATLCLALLHFSLWLVHIFGSFTLGDLRIPQPSFWQTAVAFVCFIAALQLAHAKQLKPFMQRKLAFVAMLAMSLLALWPRAIDHPANVMLFEAIDVGQGDSLLLISPDGKTLLVDGGGLGLPFVSAHQANHTEFDVGEEVVSAALWSRGIRHLDAVALTHAHHDHMGGLPAILRNFHPRELWVGNNPPVAAYESLLQQATTLGVQIHSLHTGDTMPLGDATIRVLAPELNYRPGPQPANNDSLVLQASYRTTSVLLAGDAEAPEEHTILAHSKAIPATSQVSSPLDTSLHSTVLKVGHHGSVTSTRPEFLSAVSPQWAVISCGRHNRFGHPRFEILEELQAAHVRTLRTDTGGAACLLLDGQTVTPDPGCLGASEK
ncbi:ComEC/Rec2 family competence protein [Acidicapsa dinghuensis]|uniref:ComEC/Rec2 family competence protein n=1 Tax=Acidicapsa dinghuensis TaxID=2218256 RepID=A0ABW1EIA3_9BACT|nr:ComEC/Rec2 family competence protein [Acidicapsa dinghuensis]